MHDIDLIAVQIHAVILIANCHVSEYQSFGKYNFWLKELINCPSLVYILIEIFSRYNAGNMLCGGKNVCSNCKRWNWSLRIQRMVFQNYFCTLFTFLQIWETAQKSHQEASKKTAENSVSWFLLPFGSTLKLSFTSCKFWLHQQCKTTQALSTASDKSEVNSLTKYDRPTEAQ